MPTYRQQTGNSSKWDDSLESAEVELPELKNPAEIAKIFLRKVQDMERDIEQIQSEDVPQAVIRTRNGAVDDVVIDCDQVHLEQMDDDVWSLIVYRGEQRVMFSVNAEPQRGIVGWDSGRMSVSLTEDTIGSRARGAGRVSYIDDIAQDIYTYAEGDWVYPISERSDADLYRIYAVLCLAKGQQTTARDVHNAWSAWTSSASPSHRSLIPFECLSTTVQALDMPYVQAIHRVAAEREEQGE